MINIIWTYQEKKQRSASTDSADEAKRVIEDYITKGISIENTPIFICSEVDEINKIQNLYKELYLPDDKKPVILLLKDQELSQESRGEFTFFKTDEQYEKGKSYKLYEVDEILGVVTKAREIGIAHDQTFEKGFLGSDSAVSFKFSEDDPKKYFEAFMEFVAYGSKEGDEEAIKKYWEQLLQKFKGSNFNFSKFVINYNDGDHAEIFNYDRSLKCNELKEYSERKLQEKGITKEKSIYNGNHGFVGKIIDGRLYIKSSKDFDGGLFKKGNGVATIFGDFNVEGIDKITADNIGGIAAQDPRLATAVTAAVRQLQRFKDIADLAREDLVYSGYPSVFRKEGELRPSIELRGTPSDASVAPSPSPESPTASVEEITLEI